jgi:hypothetical protein
VGPQRGGACVSTVRLVSAVIQEMCPGFASAKLLVCLTVFSLLAGVGRHGFKQGVPREASAIEIGGLHRVQKRP